MYVYTIKRVIYMYMVLLVSQERIQSIEVTVWDGNQYMYSYCVHVRVHMSVRLSGDNACT